MAPRPALPPSAPAAAPAEPSDAGVAQPEVVPAAGPAPRQAQPDGPAAGVVLLSSAPAAQATSVAAVPALAAPAPQPAVRAARSPSPAPFAAGAAPAPQVEHIAAAIRLATLRGAQRVTISLSPRELGAVAIQVSRLPSGAASVSLSVERPETLALLQRETPALQSALDRAGTPALDRHVTMTLASDPAGSSALGNAQGGGGGESTPWQGSGTPRGEAGRPPEAGPDTAIPPAPAAVLRAGAARAGIDITA